MCKEDKLTQVFSLFDGFTDEDLLDLIELIQLVLDNRPDAEGEVKNG